MCLNDKKAQRASNRASVSDTVRINEELLIPKCVTIISLKFKH